MDARPEAKAAVRGAVVVAVVALLVATVRLADGPGRYTTQPGRSWPASAMLVLAAAAFAAAGITGGRRGALLSVPPLVAVAALVAPVWSAWVAGPDALRSVADVASAFVFGAVVHAGLRSRRGRLTSRTRRSAVVAAYAVAGGAAVVVALVRDPYLDRGCLANCDVNVFLVAAHPGLADTVQSVGRWATVAVAAVVVIICVAEMSTASRTTRRQLAPVAITLSLFVAATAVHGALLESRTVDSPADDVMFAAFITLMTAVVLVGSALVVDAVRRDRQRRAVARIATDVADAPQPGSLESALRRTLQDPTLSIAYWDDERGRWLDAAGGPVEERSPRGPDRRATTLTRGDDTIAIITHSDAVPELASELGAANLLGLENERLQAAVLSQLADIRASRARIVKTGDDERRRLERDLHDGAQQQLLAVLFDLRLAQSRAVPGSGAAVLLAGALEQTGVTLAELRQLAHGIYPAVLDEVGLVGALETFAATAPMPVKVAASVDVRWPPVAEAAAYFAVIEVINDARSAGASYVAIDVAGDPAQLAAIVRSDGEPPEQAPVAAVDRIGAIGGTVDPVDHGWRLMLPCG